ncbi:MAG: hypothetical protein LBB89_12790 [Treponema sp.]|jgi:hypothetical protein|nr:hypothetical protein [Treponema sp.]
MSEYTPERYTKDAIRAIDAKFEAQKIAFAPLPKWGLLLCGKIHVTS